MDELFGTKKMTPACNYIVEKATDFHFLLVNEAHYSAQNRAFTRSLLEPLWAKGYRYLALETLSYEDTLLMQRGYPLLSSGYYTKETVFGNLVRDALKIGYQLIPYEVQRGQDAANQDSHNMTFRDSMQAVNIFESTLKKDTVGKVLVHAGYSHIAESGDNPVPMGAQLKKISGLDLLTVDQVKMLEKTDETKLHHYYKHAIEQFDFDQPVVFLDNDNKSLVDEVTAFGVDIQVYHPPTNYVNGRPSWMISANSFYCPLPELLTKKYAGHLIQAMQKGDAPDAVPVDQFVIDNQKQLILPSGEYSLRLIDCEGVQRAIVDLHF